MNYVTSYLIYAYNFMFVTKNQLHANSSSENINNYNQAQNWGMEGLHLFIQWSCGPSLESDEQPYSHINWFRPAFKDQRTKNFHLHKVGEQYWKLFIK